MTQPVQGKAALALIEERRKSIQLGVDWEADRNSFLSSLLSNLFVNLRLIFVPGPREKDLPAESAPLRISWIGGKTPLVAMFLSVLWHFAFVFVLLLPIWQSIDSNRPQLAPVQIELTWYPPPEYLPPISPRKPLAVKPNALRESPKIPLTQTIDDSHSRQTIISIRARLTHPRQTLIRPDAPATAPKILPELPNIVQWSAGEEPDIPKLQFAAATPKSQIRLQDNIAAPEIQNAEKTPAELNLAQNPLENAKPTLALNAKIAPVFRARTASGDQLLPRDLAPGPSDEDAGLKKLIAISANPAPPAPVVAPEGNLAARVIVSPGSKRPSGDSGLPDRPEISNRSMSGPLGISVSRPNFENRANSPSVAGVTKSTAHSGSNVSSSIARLNPHPGPIKVDPNLPPESILGGKQMYTLRVNLPNLTSASGSWILNFAELDESSAPWGELPSIPLEAPAPLKKVDPKYPPELVNEGVEGEVVLYGIIRSDGTIDSLQVIRSVDPQLDKNAEEALSQWKFRPAMKNNTPINVEAVVHIPFHIPAVPRF